MPPRRFHLPAPLRNRQHLFALFGIITFALLWWRLPDGVPITADTVRDLLLARRCGHSPCLLVGPSTSVPGLYQGGAWIVHLALALAAGMSPMAILVLSAATLALGVWILLRTADALEPAGTAFPAALLLVALHLGPFSYWHYLWNPSLLLLPAAAFLALTCFAARTGSLAAYGAAGIAAALAGQLHPVGFLLYPGLLAVLLLRPPRSGRSLAIVVLGAGLLLSVVALSKDAVAAFLAEFSLASARQQLGIGQRDPIDSRSLFLPLVALLGTGWSLRSPSPEARRTAAVLLATSVLPALLVAGAAWATDRTGAVRYLLPFLPGLCIGAAITLRPLGRRPVEWLWRRGIGLGTLAPLLLLFLLLLPNQVQQTGWTLDEAATVAASLDGQELQTLEEAAAAVRGPQAYHLLLGLSLDRPPARELQREPSLPSGAEVLTAIPSTTEPPPELPPDWTTQSGDGGRTIYLYRHAAALQWRALEVAWDDGPWIAATPLHGEPRGLPYLGPTDRDRTRIQAPFSRMGLRAEVVPPDDGARFLVPFAPCPDEGDVAVVVALDGLASTSEAGGIRLAGGQRGKRGMLHVEWRFEEPVAPFYFSAFVAEADGADEALLGAVLEGARCP